MDTFEEIPEVDNPELDWRSLLWQKIEPRLRNRQFWQASGLLLLANFVLVAFGLIRTPLITWALPKDEVGMLGVVASWIPFIGLASLSGLNAASHHYVSKGQPWAYVVNLTYRLRWSLLSTAGFLIAAVYWAWRGDSLLGWLFVIAGITFPITSGLSASAGMLGAQERFKNLFWYRIFEGFTRFAGFIPLILSTWLIGKVVVFYAANQIALGVMLIIVAVLLVKQLLNSKTDPMPEKEKKEMVRYGKHLTAIGGITTLQNRTDALLVSALLPLTTMADYSIGLLVYGQIKRLWGIYSTIRYPPLVRMHIDRRHRRFIIEGCIVFIGLAIIGFAIGVFSHLLVPIIFPPNYITSLFFIDWLIATFIIGIPGFFAEMYFRTLQDERRQYMIRTAAATIGVVFPLVFILLWGAKGAVIGRFLSSLMLSIIGLSLAIWGSNKKIST